MDQALARLMSGTSRTTIQRWATEGRVRVADRVCRARDSVQGGDSIEVEPGEAPPSRAEPDASVVFDVLFEDPHLIVVDKPAGLVVHPARGHSSGTLVNGLLARGSLARAAVDPEDPDANMRPGIVHRIDKDTSGVLVVAKDDLTREGLKAQLAAHSVERKYLALTLGVPKSGTIRSFHARHPRSRLRFTSRAREGKLAITHVSVVERLASGRAAFVECRLETGRTHQIRVHLAEQARTPILADALYGRMPEAEDLAAVARALGRQALHAAVLGFIHPVTSEPLRFESPLPAAFARALLELRALARD